MTQTRSDLEVELAKARSEISWYGVNDVYYVRADSLIYSFGITEIDGVPILVEPDPILEFRGD